MTPDLTLYVKTGCPFCERVLRAVDALGLSPTIKNVSEEGVIPELLARGGKRTTPFLVDATAGVTMYESDAIISYLTERYGKGAPPASPDAPQVCPA